MRKATILATLALLLFSLTFAWGEGERVDAENVLKNASNSIVGISMSRSVGGNMQHSFGPGVFIEVDGDTTSHLLVQGSLWTTSASNPSFSVFLPTGVVTASLVKTDVENRFAIIKINKPYEDAKPVDFTGGKNLEVGDMAYVVYVLPQVLGLRPAIRTSKVTYISGRSRRDNGRMLQTDLAVSAPALQGASGALAYSLDGSLIGMMRFESVENEEVGIIFENWFVAQRIQDLFRKKSGQKVHLEPSEKPGWFGITYSVNTPTTTKYYRGVRPEKDYGVFIGGMLANSPAASNRFKVMDLIYEINNYRIENEYADIPALFASFTAGETVKVKYLRYNPQDNSWMDKDKEITVEPRPATYFSDTDYENTFFGFKANEFSDSLRLRTYILNRFNGVYLAEVTPGGQFAMNIIPAGSVIIKVGETFTPDLPSLKGAISEYEQVGKSFKMLVCKPDGYNMPVYCTVKVVGE